MHIIHTSGKAQAETKGLYLNWLNKQTELMGVCYTTNKFQHKDKKDA